MNIAAITSVFDMGKEAIKRIWPDPIKQAEEIRKLEEMRQRGNLAELEAYVKITLAQIEVNNTSAKSKSILVAGARPFIIWVGGFSLAYAGLIYPLLLWVWKTLQALGTIPLEIDPPPFVESATLGTIVTGLLGVATMRSYDKKQGTQTDRIKI